MQLGEHNSEPVTVAEPPANRRLWLAALPCMLIITALLYLFPLSTLNMPGLALMVLGLSWCLYQYFLPLHLIRRRAMLEYVTSTNSVLRRLLWNGVLSKLLLSVWALLLSLALLILLNGFAMGQWLVLLAGIPLLLLSMPMALRLTSAESSQRYHFAMALRVAVWLTIVLTLAAMIVWYILGPGVEDTRHLSLPQLVSRSWSSGADAFTVPEIGWLLRIEAVVNDVVWHLMQQASLLSQQSIGIKFSAWLLFLCFVSLQMALFWFVMGGVVSWLTAPRCAEDRLLAGGRCASSFAIGICSSVGLCYVLTLPGVSGFASRLLDQSMQSVVFPAVDLCRQRERAELSTDSAQFSTVAVSAMQSQLLAQLDTSLDTAFTLAESAVDEYLDWNFSISGQYLQLAWVAGSAALAGSAAVAGVFGDGNETSPGQYVEQALSQRLSGKIDEYVGPVLTPALQQAASQLQQQFVVGAEQIHLQQAQYIEAQLSTSDCLQLNLPALQTSELVNKSAVGVGPAVAWMVTNVATRGGVRLGANVMSRNLTKRAVSATATRVAARTAQASSAGGAGLYCGPLAPICTPALFVSVWLATDMGINKIDEILNREQLRGEMLAALAAEKQRIRAEYQQLLEGAAEQLMASFTDYQDERFRILDHLSATSAKSPPI